MAEQIYVYDYPTSGFTWNAYHQKVKQAIGRVPHGTTKVNNDKIALRFDPPLDGTEEPLVAAIFADSATACSVPEVSGSTFIIGDIWDSSFLYDLSTALGCDVWIWFYRSDVNTPERSTDKMAITFSKTLSVQEKKTAENAFKALIEGWGTVVEV